MMRRRLLSALVCVLLACAVAIAGVMVYNYDRGQEPGYIKTKQNRNREGLINTFRVEPIPGLLLVCVEAARSGGLWCMRWEWEKES